jgi:hypothetical protein
MGAVRDGRELTAQMAWRAVRGKLVKARRDGDAAERVFGPAVAAAVADMTADELAVLRRRGKVPDWFLGEVRRNLQAVDEADLKANLKDAQVRPLTYQDAAPMKHAAAAALGGMASL